MNRDMYYQNLNQGYQNPGMVIPPSGYNMNTNIQAYGPNIMPNNAMVPNNANMMSNQGMQTNYDMDFYDKFDKIDRQIKNLDTRLQKLEASVSNTNDNIYMI